jgi:lysophospholipase L1-like esterase
MHIRPSILLFGDSITQCASGEGTVKFGWASLLSSAFQRRADVFNRGFSGYNTRHALELVHRVFGAVNNNHEPNHLFITVFFGANDAAIPGERQHVPLKEYGENLTKIIQAIRKEIQSGDSLTDSPPIIIMTPPPIDEEAWKNYLQLFDYYDRKNDVAREYGLEAKRVAKELNCSVLDTWELLGGNEGDHGKHLCDGLHLSESGNELIFDGLMKLIKTEYPHLSPQEMVDGKYQGAGIPEEEKLWDELC